MQAIVYNKVADFAEQRLLAELSVLVLRSTGLTEEEWVERMAAEDLPSDLRSPVWQKLTQKLSDEEPQKAPLKAGAVVGYLRAAGIAAVKVPLLWAALQGDELQRRPEREEAVNWLSGPTPSQNLNRELFIQAAMEAFYLTKVVLYAQILEWCRKSSPLEVDEVAKTLVPALVAEATEEDIEAATTKHLFLAPSVAMLLTNNQGTWRRLLGMAQRYGVALPMVSSALAYFDAYRDLDNATAWWYSKMQKMQ